MGVGVGEADRVRLGDELRTLLPGPCEEDVGDSKSVVAVTLLALSRVASCFCLFWLMMSCSDEGVCCAFFSPTPIDGREGDAFLSNVRTLVDSLKLTPLRPLEELREISLIGSLAGSESGSESTTEEESEVVCGEETDFFFFELSIRCCISEGLR